MIKEKVKLVKTNRRFVTRICDECGKEEKSRMGVILDGRKRREKEIDLCRKCANSRDYKPETTWPKNEKSHLWKGGRRKSGAGLRIHISPGKWIYEHRLVMENFLNRKLITSEIVHHIDLNKFNNDINNLYLCENRKEHGLIHGNLELSGYKLLGKKIWFDYNEKKYVSYKTRSPSDEYIELDKKYKIHIFKRCNKSGRVVCYQVYNVPEGDGKYSKKYVHIEIMKRILGRELYSNEVVHHIDGDGLNNMNRNLIVLNNKKHISCHRGLQKEVIKLMNSGDIKFIGGKYCA